MKGKKVQEVERHKFNKLQDQSENHHHNKKRQRKRTAKNTMKYAASEPEECQDGVMEFLNSLQVLFMSVVCLMLRQCLRKLQN